VHLRGIVQDLSDGQAIVVQVKENQKVGLSDYSKGMNYAKILEENKTSIAKLSKLLGYSKTRLNHFLCFKKVPHQIWEVVGNPSRVSSRTAATIHSLAKKGQEYIDALIELAEEISKGTGSKTIEKAVLEAVSGHNPTIEYEQKIVLPSGQLIAKWTKGGLQFSKDISLDQMEIEKVLIQYFEKSSLSMLASS